MSPTWLTDPPEWISSTLTCVLVTVLLIQVSLTAPVAADHATADEALNQKQTAERLLSELVELSETDEVSIDRQLIQNVRARIEEGQIHYDRAEYHAAHEKWKTAANQARALLEQGYLNRSKFLLNASAAHLKERREAGYVAPKQSDLETRHQDISEDMEAVDSLSEARQVHANAEKLHSDVEALPRPRAIQIGLFLDRFWFVTPAAGVLVLVVGILIGRMRYASREPPRSKQITREKEKPTPSTIDGSDYRNKDD